MLRMLLQPNTLQAIPLTVLLIFFTVVAGVVLWTFRPGSKQRYCLIANSLFTEGEKSDDAR